MKLLYLSLGEEKELFMPIDLEVEYVFSPEELLARLRKGEYLAIVIGDSEKGGISQSLLKGIFLRSPGSAVYIFSDSFTPDGRWTSYLYDEHFSMDPSDSQIDSFIDLIETKLILQKSGIAGRSDSIYGVGRVIKRVSTTELSVFITGESGTGKELVAKAIHDNSPRAEKRFLPVNCGAIPENLIEAELFGHTKGAFTGANASREGHFAQADGGTIFLDEIGELPPSAQVKLLRILESGEFFPVGSSRTKRSDVRVVAATNRDIREMVREGSFREDLYYRLGVVNIAIPPLRDRPEDILVIGALFRDELEKKYRRPLGGFSDDAIEGLLRYSFPGNVRELRNLVENSLLLAGSGQVKVSDLRSYFEQHEGLNLPTVHRGDGPGSVEIMRILGYLASELRDIRQKMDRIESMLEAPKQLTERYRIKQALDEARGNKSVAADILGISRRTLYRKLDKLDID